MTDTLVADELQTLEPTPLVAEEQVTLEPTLPVAEEQATPEERDTQAPRARAAKAKSAARNVERPLKAHELFFSTTNAKGVITSGNDVFSRASGYPLDEMIGKAHNIVRHPDMPRAVFQLLWDTISAGQPLAAYVKNRTADDAYYWVLASVVPISDGYLSVRLAPAGEHFELAKRIYAELSALEKKVEGGDVRQRKPSIAASTERLGELLAEAGYEDYGAFMRAAVPAEVIRRAGQVNQSHWDALQRTPDRPPHAIARILEQYRAFSVFLMDLVSDLSRYAEIGRSLGEQSHYLKVMGDDVRLFALNAQIGASRLGEQGAALDAVARLLTAQSQATSPLVATVAQRAGAAVREIEDMTYELSLSTLQAEMIAVFAHEIAEADEIQHDSDVSMVRLADALERGSERTFAALTTVSSQLTSVLDHVSEVSIGIDRLSRLALNGRIELASVPDAGSIRTLFSDVERQVEDARTRLTSFDAVAAAAKDLEQAARHRAMNAPAELRAGAEALKAGAE